MAKLSLYAEKLSREAKDRYLDKISTLGGVDPFSGVAIGDVCRTTPSVDACDLVSYLVLKTSFMTATQFQARKGLEAYNQFVCGWVKDVKTKKVSGKYLTCGRVSRYTGGGVLFVYIALAEAL